MTTGHIPYGPGDPGKHGRFDAASPAEVAEPADTLPAIPAPEWDAHRDWDDDTLAELRRARDSDMLPVAVAYPLAQTASDRRQVHHLRQVEATIAYWHANWNRPGRVLVSRGAVILRAAPDAGDTERLLGVRTDAAGTRAYLAEPLPAGATPRPLPAAAKRKPPRKRASAARKSLTTKPPSQPAGEAGK